ncbi:transposase [Streptomyces sp. NPDC057696]|uniref:transposase n=1 Tax=unclassified Streptomyces TaxID=2593676 RepID=UPI0036AA6967
MACGRRGRHGKRFGCPQRGHAEVVRPGEGRHTGHAEDEHRTQSPAQNYWCQVAVSVHAATDTASCPLEWELFPPEEWDSDDRRRRQAGVPDGIGHVSKIRLALGLLDRLATQGLVVPVIVADAGYGRSVCFRLALAQRG